jgi:hypothetical protein
MKPVIPFDPGITRPRSHWSSLWESAVGADEPAAEIEVVHCGDAVGEPGGLPFWFVSSPTAVKGMISSLGVWFDRRDAREQEELTAALCGVRAGRSICLA